MLGTSVSGINFERKGLKTILEGVFKGNIKEIVVSHRDRFTRFGYPLFEWICKQHNTILICDHQEETNNPKEANELTEDLMSIISYIMETDLQGSDTHYLN